MPKLDLQPVNLATIARGAALKIFDIEIAKIAANIADTKTWATKKRTLNLKITFEPDVDRRMIEVTTSSKIKLASIADHASRAWLGKDDAGNPYILDQDPRQELLFEPPSEDKQVLQFGTNTNK